MKLFDPTDPVAIWPAIDPAEQAYIAAMGQGVRSRLANVATQWLALASEDRVLPVTVNDGTRGESYVCLPSVAYCDYAIREMALMGIAGAPLVRGMGVLLRLAGIDRIVNIDNWLLSTNLHGEWAGRDLPAIRRLLVERFPDHVLAIRSIDDWSSPVLSAAVRADGWAMVPSRHIWVTDDLACDWTERNAYANDRRTVTRSGLSIEDAVPQDAPRIADLYRQLYIDKYSALNPVFTPVLIAETMASGLIAYRVARGASGRVMAVAGLLVRGNVATPPVVGYDMTLPRSAGLYRIASWIFGQMAMARGLRLHGSAGAARFKRLRGAHGVIEYWAMHVDHLAPHRRLAIRTLATALERFAVPLMRRHGW